MDKEWPFLILRYFLIEESQRSLHAKVLPDVRGKCVLDALVKDREWSKNAVKYSFVGFPLISPDNSDTFPGERFYVGKIAKLRKAHVGEKVPGDIIEHEEDDWIPLITIIDIKSQSIVVHKDWRFGTPEQICGAIESGLRQPILDIYNHRIFVEPKPTKGKFWKIIKTHNKLYKLDLGLISPNILQTNAKARDAVKALQELYGQDEVQLKLKNEAGALTVPVYPTSDYIDYIEEGEGTWKVTTEGTHGGKKTYSSADEAEMLNIAVSDDVDVDSEQQLEIETGEPAPTRKKRDKSLVEAVFKFIETVTNSV